MPRTPKPPGTRMPSQVGELALDLAVGEPLGVDPVHLDPPPWWAPAWLSASITDR